MTWARTDCHIGSMGQPIPNGTNINGRFQSTNIPVTSCSYATSFKLLVLLTLQLEQGKEVHCRANIIIKVRSNLEQYPTHSLMANCSVFALTPIVRRISRAMHGSSGRAY
jgi:hypothetical protein